MKKYKFTILYYLILVVPFALYTLASLYLYVFTDFMPSEKALNSGFIAAVLGLMGGFVWLWESES